MAIGVRITSDNLSGKTANVTFYPLSGGTINVGSTVVPFNYINTYPYGVYDLYFSEYDYTYEVTVPDTTPLVLGLDATYTPGSIVSTYTLTSNVWVSEEITVSFTNTLGLFVGGSLDIETSVTIPYGGTSGQTVVTLGEDFNNYNGSSSFSSFSGLPSGTTVAVTDTTPNQQGIVFWTVLTGESNWSSLNFVYGPLSAQTIDFGLDAMSWYQTDIYPLTNSGYGYYFMKNDYSQMVASFTDVYGNELIRYSGSNNNLDWNNLDGIYNYFVDVDAGILIYSDGISGYTFTWDYTNYPYFDADWDYYAVTSNGSFIVRIWNDSQENKLYLLNKGTSTLINTFNSNSIYIWHDIYKYANYIIRHTANNDTNYNILTIDILELDGVTVRRTIDLSGDNYNGYSYSWWGNNKFTWILWDNNDTSLPYRILNYDGLTDTLDDQTFGNRDDYPSYIWRYTDKFFPSDNGSDSMFIFFYSDSGGGWYGWGMNRCEIFYMLSGNTTFSHYNFTDTGSPDVYLYPYAGNPGNNLFVYCSTNGIDFQTLSITMSGVQITNVATIGDGTAVGQNNYQFGDKYVQEVWKTNNYDELQLVLFNKYGEITDQLNLTLSGSFQRDEANVSGIYYITDYSYGWWVNQDTDTFQSTTNYYVRYPDGYTTIEGLRLGVMGLEKNVGGNQYFRLLFRNAEISNEWQLPSNDGGRSWDIGRTNFLYSYNDESGIFNWALYDHSGNLLQNVNMGIPVDGWDSWGVKDRYLVRMEYDGIYTYHAISDTDYIIGTSEDFGWSMINDYVWWD